MEWDKDGVRSLRKSLKLTQHEFAELLGCRQQTISEWEQGLYTPANAYGKLLSQLRAQTRGGFVAVNVLPVKEVELPKEEESEFKAFDPAVD